MIKKLISILLFADHPAPKAFFILTLWGVGLYLLLSAYLLLLPLGIVPLPPDYDGGPSELVRKVVTIPILHLAWTLVYCYYRLSAPRRWLRLAFWPLLGSSILISYWIVARQYLPHYLGAVIFFLFWAAMPALLPRVKWYEALGNLIGWGGGLLAVLTLLGNIRVPFGVIHKLSGGPSYYWNYFDGYCGSNWTWSISRFFELSGDSWVCFTLLGVTLLAAGYLLLAKILADAAKVPFRRMFGKGVRVLWSLAAVTYLLFLVMAMIASHRAAQSVQRLEQRFGQPMTMTALGQQYYRGDRPDYKFWQEIDMLHDRCFTGGSVDFYNGFCDVITPEEQSYCQKYFTQIEPALNQYEQKLSDPLPPVARDYSRGKCLDINMINFNQLISADRIEIWRVYFALRSDNLTAALQTCERIRHINDAMLRENNLNAIFRWLDAEHLWLDALQLVLESGKLSPDQLQTIAAGLADIENRVPAMQKQALYGEALACLDLFDFLGYGFRELPDAPETPPLASLRLFLPQAWWCFAMDKAYIARKFDVPDFNRIPKVDYSQNLGYLSHFVFRVQHTFGIRFDRLTARLRAAQTVIRAIEYKRQHGSYPETLDNLPIAPFTSQPMQYHVGEWKIVQTHFTPSKDWWYSQPQLDTVPAVISWSVGPDHKDNQGRDRHPGGLSPDDIAFIVRIKP